MADWAASAGLGAINTLAISGSRGTTITASGTAHTKGSWVEMTPGLSKSITGLLIQLGAITASAGFLVDVGQGAAGSEQVIIPNLLFASGATNPSAAAYYFPIRVPILGRVAVRCQSDVVSATMSACIQFLTQGYASPPTYNKVTAYGANTATTAGTTITPSGTVNTKGSYAQLSASMDRPCRGLVIGVGPHNDYARTNADFFFEIARGTAGSEKIVVRNTYFVMIAGVDVPIPMNTPFIPVSIDAGQRLAARAQSSITTADRIFSLVAYGVE